MKFLIFLVAVVICLALVLPFRLEHLLYQLYLFSFCCAGFAFSGDVFVFSCDVIAFS